MQDTYKKKFNPAEWISQAEAARIRGITRQAIATHIKRGRFTTFLMGGKTFLRRSEIENFKPRAAGRPTKRKNVKKQTNKS